MSEKDIMEYVVDLRGVRTKEELHDRIERSLPMPEHYGRNLDALYDALQEVSGVVTFEGVFDEDPGTPEDWETPEDWGTPEGRETTEGRKPSENLEGRGAPGPGESLIVADPSEIDAKIGDPFREYMNDLKITLRDAEMDNPNLHIFMM